MKTEVRRLKSKAILTCLLSWDRFQALSLFGPAWFISLTENGIEYWVGMGACINLPGSCVCIVMWQLLVTF